MTIWYGVLDIRAIGGKTDNDNQIGKIRVGIAE